MRVRLQAPVLCAIAVVAAMAGPAPGQEPGPDGPALVVAGGPAAVSDTVVEALESATDTGSARLAGPNRYATAAAVADTFPTGSPAFIAWGEGPADALAGGPAAAVAGGPVLLTRTDELPEETVAALERLAPSSITVLGGTAVVAEPVEAALAELTDGEVTRLAGPDRYATAAAIARTFPAPVDGVFIASGESFADALSAAQAAGLAGVPVLLTTTHEVPAPTTEALQALAPGALTVVGGTAAIADSVVLQLEDATGVVATRLAGDSRFTTALAVARATYPEGAQRVYLADGGDFPDALAVSPLAAGGAGAAPAFAGADPDQGDGPLVLVTDPLPDVVRDGVVELLGGTVDPAEDNEPPTADDQAVTVAAGGTVAITLTGSDPDGDPLTFAITTEPNRGTVALAGDVATYEAAGGGYTTTFTYTADDGELTSDPATVTVTVAPSAPGNRAPVVDLDPADTATVDVDAGTFTEGDAPLVLAATGTADDPDSAALASVTATLDAVVDAGAEVLAADTAGTTLTATYDPGTGELVLAPAAPATTAPEAEFTTVLQRLTYSHTGEAPTDGPRAVAVVATDAGGAASPAAEATVTVAAVNDPPTVTVPGPVTTDEDTPVAVPGISVADVDGDQVTATLTVTSGTVTTTPAGTGDGTASTVLTGTVADVNAALGTATFAPTADASGAVTMTVDVDDLGNTGTGGAGTDSDTVAITVTAVNDAPVVTVPAAASTDEDTTLTLSGVSVADVDAGGATVELELVVTGGTLSAAAGGGVNVAGSGSGTITLAGSIANLNGFASGGNVTFQPPADDDTAVTLTATADDLGNTGAGGAQTDVGTITIDLLPVNDPPVVATSGGATAFTEDGGPVAVDAALAVTDVDSTQLTGATVAITTDHVAADDVLAVTGAAGITGVYDAPTGVLTLTGAADVGDYQAVLQSVTYDNTSEDPAPATRTISVQVDDGTAPSATATKGIALNAVNDPPVVTTTGTPLALAEGDPATVVDPGVTVTDVDDTDLDGATVSISTGFDAGDVLGFTDTAAITGTYTAGTGMLALTGTASLAEYQAALRSITFSGTSDTPTAAKVVTFVADDGTTASAAATRDLTVTPVDDPPVVTTSAGTTAFTEDGGPVAVDGALTVTDPDSAQLTGATVAITADHDAVEDVLAVAGALGISGSYSSATGLLTLSGTADVGDYQTVLRTVTFDNGSQDPSPTTRTVTVTVTDATSSSVGATKGLTLIGVNDPPEVTTTGTPLAVDEGDPPTPVDTGLTVTDVDDTDLEGATVSISTGFDAGDVLGFTDTAAITGTYTAGTGMLALTGTASLADYQAALRSITFSGTDTSPTTAKVVSFVVDDGTDPSAAATRDITVTDLNDPPVAVDDTVDVIGNTGLFVGTTRPAVEAGWVVTGSLLDNDTDAENDPLFVEPVTNGTTTLGGTITIAADGTFTYHPDASSTGVTDTIAYRVCDSDPCSSAVPNDTGQLSLPVAGLVWYVDNSAAPGGDGTSDSPFDTLAAGDAASTAGDTLFVHAGTGDATGLGGGVVLETGERLLGQAVALTLDPDGPGGPDPVVTLLPATANAHPRLTASGTDVVTLATVNVVSGVQLDPDGAGSGIAGGATAGSAVIEQVRVIDAGTPGTQPAVELSGTSGQVVLTDVVVETPATGVRANGANTVRFDSGVRITSTGSVGLHVSGTNLASSSVEAVSVSGSSAGGVVLTSNTGSISFGDLALVTTGTTPGFSATGGGTVAVPAGGTATVDATGGPALVVDSTAIGAADLTFDRLSSNGATNGIRLDSTGTSGRLVVEGTPDGTRDGSGGLITNTTGDGVVLTSTLGPTLRDLDITNAGDQGGEHAVQVTNVTGTATIDEARITDPANDGVVITSTAGTMNLDITESEVRHTTPGRPFSDDGIVVEPAGSATTTVAISDVTFTDLVGHAVRSVPTSTGLTTLTLTDSTSTVSTAGRVGGVTVNGQGVASTAITIDGNTFTDARGTAVVSVDANDTSIITGSVSDNDITRPARAGIEVIADEGGSATVTVDDNTVTDAGSDGIILVSYAGMGLSTLDARVTNNTVNGHNLDPGQAFVGGIVVFGFEDAVDLRLTGNTVTGTPGGGACGGISCVDVHLEEAGATFRMEEVPESTATPNADPAYVISVNPGVADVAVFGTIPLSNGAVITG